MRRVPLIFILALLCWPAAAQADEADPLFDTGSVAQVDITLPDSSRAALEADPRTDVYQPATLKLTVAGTTYGPIEVGVRLKGNATFRTLDQKAAFKIKLNWVSGQKLLGLKKLTLNNMVQDDSMVHEALAYETFRAAGVPASRTGYAFVRVNGQAYGVYLNVETLDDVSLKRMFASTGHLYENGFATDLKDDDWKWFEVDEGDEDDRADLRALVDAAKAPGALSDRMAGKADLDQMVTMWATEKYIGHWDGYAGKHFDWTPNNYYLHSTTGGLFSMLPWGTDQTWVDRIGFDEGGVLFRQCRADASCDASFREALARVTRTATGLGLQAEARRLAAMLAPYQREDPRKESSMSDVDWWVGKAVQYMDQRPGDVAALLGDPSLVPEEPPAPPPAPQNTDDEADAPPPAAPAETASGATGTGSAPAPALRLRVGTSRRKGAVISTPVRLPRAGKVSQRTTMTVAGRAVTVCTVPARRMKQGRHTLRCRLTRTARGRLRRGSLRVTQVTRIAGLAPVRVTARLGRCHGC